MGINMKEKNGEHPFGDIGQLILLCLFLGVWIADSFFLRKSTFLSEHFPLYIRLIILGLSVSTASLLSLGMLVVIFVFYNYIASYEEKLLIERFGDEYARYKKRTGKWVPRILKGS